MSRPVASLALLVVMLGLAACEGGSDTTYVARDDWLRSRPARLYPARGGVASPRAVIVFFGNDLGFWRPAQRLADDLASSGYAVAGVDIVPLLGGLPEPPSSRDSAFSAQIVPLIAHAYRELAGDDASWSGRSAPVPLLLLGHSLGAEIALRAASATNEQIDNGPRIAGIVALSPGLRSHLRVTASDLLMADEPKEPGSFAVGDAVRAVTSSSRAMRVAIVRGSHDKLRYADSTLLAAGEARARRFVVPFAGHSLARLTISRVIVRQALGWVLDRDGADTLVGVR